MNVSVVSRNIGIALLVNAAFMFMSVIVSIIYGFESSFSPLLLSAVITLIVGLFPLIFVTRRGEVNMKEGFTIIVLSWVLSCVFGMLPYVLWGGPFTLINAWFESVSGYTTTGATILSDIESLPKSLLFWRSSTHFIGGIGVVIFMLLILPSMSTFKMRLSKIEISALSKESYRFKTRQTIMIIAYVFVGLTIVETGCLYLAGMDFFDAVNHAFSTISTGGFSTRNMSIASFHSFPIELVIVIFMIISGMHFGLLYSAFVERSGKIFRSPVIRMYLATIAIATLLMTANLLASNTYTDFWRALWDSLFQVSSIITTTGFATVDTSVWPALSILVLTYLSIQCACSGSTTGGLKTDRVVIFWNAFKSQLLKQMHPKGVIPVKVGEMILDRSMVISVLVYIVLYAVLLLLGALLLASMGVDLIDSFSASVANLGNVGPGFGTVGSLGNYSQIPAMGKFVLALQSLLGRLEIYSLLILFVIWKWR